MTDYYAHSRPNDSTLPEKSKDDWHLLRDHLLAVGEGAAYRASCWGQADEARLAGLLHDLGKYASNFQKRLEGITHGVDHWSIGAYWAAMQGAHIAAFAIYGHHVGLHSPSIMQTLLEKAKDPGVSWNITEYPDDIKTVAGNDRLQIPSITSIDYKGLLKEKPRCGMAIRMLFSALCDADFIDTEAHFNRYQDNSKRPNPLPLQAAKALEIVLAHLGNKPKPTDARAQTVYKARQTVLHDSLEAASRDEQLFTLTAPTGSGKTLASLAFALKHAAIKKDLRRVIVVIPYLSIIDQTARQFHELFEPVFGPDYVLEHHSLAERAHENRNDENTQDAEDEARRRRRLLAQNWDAPLVVTTTVQFFESLFANSPTACRKLHNIAKSVVYFDEAQTLPTSLAVPTLEALNALMADYGVTVVFGTATKPAFETLASTVGGWQPREIVRDVASLFDKLKRVDPKWPTSPDDTMAWDQVAASLIKHRQALCVVNLKKHAAALTRILLELVAERPSHRIFHLSTAMCPAHRQQVLDQVRQCLSSPHRENICLVSTQCIEAGVDIDFPVVWRALGPLEGLAQAFGRCNREGQFLPEDCEAKVFIPEDSHIPMRDYAQAADIARTHHWNANIHDPATFSSYFARLYDSRDLAGQGGTRQQDLRRAIDHLDFPEVAERYRIIDSDTISVVVPYLQRGLEIRNALERHAPNAKVVRALLKEAQPYTVNLFRSQTRDPSIAPNLKAIPGQDREEWYLWKGTYDQVIGVTGEVPPDLLVV
jgi:CRISPR-associated helicase Cas3/CRISPR-associated endonuclease Cas3-HD